MTGTQNNASASLGWVTWSSLGLGITGLGDYPVKDLPHRHERMALYKAGDTVELRVWRDGRTFTLRAVLEDYR